MELQEIVDFIESDPRVYLATEYRDGAPFMVDFTVEHPGYDKYFWLIWTVTRKNVEVLVQFNNGSTPRDGGEPDWWYDGEYAMSHEAFIEYVQSLPKSFTAWATETKTVQQFIAEQEA